MMMGLIYVLSNVDQEWLIIFALLNVGRTFVWNTVPFINVLGITLVQQKQ